MAPPKTYVHARSFCICNMGCLVITGMCFALILFLVSRSRTWLTTHYASSLLTRLDGMFAFREINQMEQETCSHLEWQLNINPLMLHNFQDALATKVLPQLIQLPHMHQVHQVLLQYSQSHLMSHCPRTPQSSKVCQYLHTPPYSLIPQDALVIPSPSIPAYRSSLPDTPRCRSKSSIYPYIPLLAP